MLLEIAYLLLPASFAYATQSSQRVAEICEDEIRCVHALPRLLGVAVEGPEEDVVVGEVFIRNALWELSMPLKLGSN